MLLMTHMWCKTRNVHERQKMNDCMFHQVVMRTQEHAVSACYAVLGCAMLCHVQILILLTKLYTFS